MRIFKNTILRLLAVYLAVILLIFLFRFISAKYVLTFASALFLLIPYVLGKGLKLKININNMVFSLLVSIILVGTYLLLFALLTKSQINFTVLTLSLALTHLIAVAFPEEAFFRGYLQEELGNNKLSIVIVSIFFALGHLITICAYSGHLGLHCVSALLTFLPSLVMGYLYYKTRSIWGSVLFHFLANIAYLLTGGYSVFY